MSAAPAPRQATSTYARRYIRYAAAIPVDIVLLRAGVPDTLPGRSLDVSEAGISVVVAGELQRGQSVGIQLVLPGATSRVQARATVKHGTNLQYGFEFHGLSKEQKKALGCCVGSAMPDDRTVAPMMYRPDVQTELEQSTPRLHVPSGTVFSSTARKYAWVLGVVPLAAVTAVWWSWQSSWRELESKSSTHITGHAAVRMAVPWQIMQGLLVHRVDPLYPESLRSTGAQGTVLLNAVIGRDGTVLDLQPVTGPEDLHSAATDAVRWWRFEPYRAEGQPLEVQTTIAVEFRP